MFSEKDILIAKEIAQKIELPEDFGPYEDDGSFDTYFIEEQLKSFKDEYGEFDVRYGISKLVIIFEKLSFVIKIPFDGLWYYEYEEDGDSGQYYSESRFEYFCGASGDWSNDYCAAEVNIIEAVKHFGYGTLVADETTIGNFKGHNFYIQEKVMRSTTSKARVPSEDSLRRAESMKNCFCYCSDSWRANVIDLYGMEFWESFVNWSDLNYPMILSDMHGGNYGYRYDGTPVMFDISGYDE